MIKLKQSVFTPPRIAMRFNKSLLCSFLMLVLLGVGWTQTIYVDQNSEYDEQDGSEQYPYHEVGAAVVHAEEDEAVDTIIIHPGTYTENISMFNFPRNLAFKSTYDSPLDNEEIITATIIQGAENVFDSVFYLSHCGGVISFWGLSIRNGKGHYVEYTEYPDNWTQGGGICAIGNENLEQHVRVEWCDVYENYACWGGGIYGIHACFTISNTNIHDNALYFKYSVLPPDTHGLDQYNGSKGGGIYLAGGWSTISQCKIYGNRSFMEESHELYNSLCYGNASALVWRNTCAVNDIGMILEGCEIYDNVTDTADEQMGTYDWPMRNIVQIQRGVHSVEPGTGNGYNHVEINHCTITGNRVISEYPEQDDPYVNAAVGILRLFDVSHIRGTINNNIIYNNTAGLDLTDQSTSRVDQLHGGYYNDGGEWIPQIIPIKHCCVNDAYDAEQYSNDGGNIDEDPLFVDHTVNNYNLRWDSDVISPCIDAGYSEDEDGTPADIGAIPAIQHRYWEYSFENQHDLDKWYWVSYPILNTITDNALIASEFFNELLVVHPDFYGNDTPTYLEEIDWFNQQLFQIEWDDWDEWNDLVGSHPVSSPQGYKIKLQSRLNPEFTWPVTLKESGLKTPDSTIFPIYGGVENWVGYFKEDSQYPEDAFADIWDDLVSVRAKNWSIARDESTGLMMGKKGTLNCGDMVIVCTNDDHDFQWGGNSSVPSDHKPEVKGFVYDEKPDYIPLYVSLSDSLLQDLDEIGLYVDGVCKGAVVVEDSLEQLSAYLDNAAELSEGNVEFVFYYNDSKSMGQQMKSMKLPVGRLQPKYSQAGSAYPYFELKLSPEDMDSIVPPEFSLRQNYPNPFNPSTTISYSLPIAGKVRLDIYNVKGQLVKTLLNKDMEAGLHSIIWNGRDMNNQSVASGIYFYRLSSPSMTQTKRMLLMK